MNAIISAIEKEREKCVCASDILKNGLIFPFRAFTQFCFSNKFSLATRKEIHFVLVTDT